MWDPGVAAGLKVGFSPGGTVRGCGSQRWACFSQISAGMVSTDHVHHGFIEKTAIWNMIFWTFNLLPWPLNTGLRFGKTPLERCWHARAGSVTAFL